jgi:hypothetical protein
VEDVARQKADETQAALDEVFGRLPANFQTDAIRTEMAKAIVHGKRRSRRGYKEAAQRALSAMFDSPEKALCNRRKLAPFADASSI